MIDLVAFDLGGVLVDVEKARLWRSLGRAPAEVEAAFFREGRHEAYASGHLDEPRFFAAAAAELAVPIAQARAAWCDMVRTDARAACLIAGLAVPCVAWSNTDPAHLAALKPTLPTPLLGEARALSFELLANKPAESFFRRALERVGASARAVLFLDDRPENVAAARALGITAVRVRGIPETRRVLELHRLLRSSPP